MNKRSFTITAAILSIIAPLLLVWPARAATKAHTGITVSPAFQRVIILGTETETEIQFTVTNNEPSAETLHLSGSDFSSLNESGGLLFVGTNPTDLQKKYGLTKWLSLPQDVVTVGPKQTTVITATILNQTDLSPGGHYGALMLSLEPLSGQKNRPHAAINPIASSLIFANKIGGDIHSLKMTDVSVQRRPFSKPGSVTLRFYNQGNIDLTPRGSVQLTDKSGKIFQKGIVNENSGLILPETYRRYLVPMRGISGFSPFKTYKLIVNYRFDGYQGFRTYQTSLFVISPLGWLILVAIIAAGAWAFIQTWRLPNVKSEMKHKYAKLARKFKR